MKSTSLPGFTLVEITVVLLLSFILVSIIYFVLCTSVKSFILFRSSNDNVEKTSAVYDIVSGDFETSDKIVKMDGGLIFKKFFHPDVSYTIQNECIVRHFNGVIDTLTVKCSNVKMYLFNNEVIKDEGYVDELVFNDKQDIPFHFSKMYAANQLIQLDSNKTRNQ